MYIEKINIVSFGRLVNCEFSLGPEVNIIEGNNESGKTTIASFIRFVLYGMKGAVGTDRYMSWDGASASGSLTVSAEGRRIHIERRAALTGARGAVRETVRMTDLDTGLEIHSGECPGEALFGVPEEVFSGTAFVNQMGGAPIDGGKMSASAENLLFSADEAINTEKAAERIDLQRRQLLYKNNKGGAIYEKESKIAALTADLERAKLSASELIGVEVQISELEKKREAAAARRDEARLGTERQKTLSALRMFDRLRALRVEMASLEGERQQLLANEPRFGGNVPDIEYIGELRAAADGMSATSASIAAASRQLDGLRSEEAECPDRELYGRLNDDEDGVDGVIGDILKTAAHRSVFSVVALLALVLAGACAAIAVIFGDGGTLTLSLSAAAAVFVLAAVSLTAAAVVSSVKYRRELRRYGARNRGELKERLLEESYNAGEYRRLEERIGAAETELYVQYSVYDDEKRDARALLARSGMAEDIADDELAAALTETVSAAEALTARDRELAAKVRAYDRDAADLERRLYGVDEDEVRAAAESLDGVEYDETAAANLKREFELAEGAQLRLTEAIHELEVKRAQLMATRTDPAAISSKIDTVSRELAEDRARYDACMLAIEALGRAGQGVRESVAPRLREMAREYMERISDGKYTDLGVDAKFGVTVPADGAYRELELMSGGTVDATYLSLRLALVKLLFRRETPPLIFDEAFSRMDDDRTRALLSMITGMQSLILTCQRREGELARGMGQINRISLT